MKDELDKGSSNYTHKHPESLGGEYL